MKFAFASCMIVAMAAAADDAAAPASTTSVEQPQVSLDDIFELNDEGRYELRELDLDLPEISFADNEAQAEQWVADTEAAYAAIDQMWVDAWKSYEAAIQQPWNDFLDEAERLTAARGYLEIQNAQEVVNFVANNTYVDDETLNEAVPQIQEQLARYVEWHTQAPDNVSFDKLRIQTAMRKMKRVPVSLQVGDMTYEIPAEGDDSTDDDGPSRAEQLGDKIEEALITYGYDPAVVNEWFATSGANWEALDQ